MCRMSKIAQSMEQKVQAQKKRIKANLKGLDSSHPLYMVAVIQKKKRYKHFILVKIPNSRLFSYNKRKKRNLQNLK